MSALIWFRKDLRVIDNESLYYSTKNHKSVIAYYNFNPETFRKTKWGFKKTERFRAQFLIESISQLKNDLLRLNISLIIDHDSEYTLLNNLIKKRKITDIYLQKEWTQEEISEEKFIGNINKIKLHHNYGQFLFNPNDLNHNINQTPEIFTNFRKNCEKFIKVRPLSPKPFILEKSNLVSEKNTVPDLKTLGLKKFDLDSRNAFVFIGGTKEGEKRIDNYFWKTKNLSSYKLTRNGLIGKNYSSRLSPWLSNGSLSAKIIYWKVREYEKEIKKNQSTYWLIFELMWRDFFKYISLKHGNKIFQSEGILSRKYDWSQDINLIKAWCCGKTKHQFINSNMNELNKSGWMSNRGRQNVASYFAKDLKINWIIGAAYFESMLIDYDVHSNYGNWMYISGVGNNPRDRKFDIDWQAERYDPKKEFQKLWSN